MKSIRLVVQGIALALVVAGTTGSAEGQEITLPNEDYPKLVAYAVHGIKDALKDPTEETNIRKAHTAAVKGLVVTLNVSTYIRHALKAPSPHCTMTTALI